MRWIDKVRSTGMSDLGDEDLLTLLLTNGRDEVRSRQLAAVLLDEFGGVPGLGRLAHERLGSIGEMGSLRLAAAFELGLRCLERSAPLKIVRCSADIVPLLGPRLSRSLHEQVWVVALDSRNRLIARRRVAEGGLHGCAVQPSDVLRAAISLGASCFILVHNHPGGDPSPSRQDLDLTERLCEAACRIGIPLLDHVIVAGDEHRSLLDLGLLNAVDPDHALASVAG
jgi:DNA repair protein RadC